MYALSVYPRARRGVVMTKAICHTILLDLLVVSDLLVTRHPPDQASYGPGRSDQIWFSSYILKQMIPGPKNGLLVP